MKPNYEDRLKKSAEVMEPYALQASKEVRAGRILAGTFFLGAVFAALVNYKLLIAFVAALKLIVLPALGYFAPIGLAIFMGIMLYRIAQNKARGMMLDGEEEVKRKWKEWGDSK